MKINVSIVLSNDKKTTSYAYVRVDGDEVLDIRSHEPQEVMDAVNNSLIKFPGLTFYLPEKGGDA